MTMTGMPTMRRLIRAFILLPLVLQGYGLIEDGSGDDGATVGLLKLNGECHYEESIHSAS